MEHHFVSLEENLWKILDLIMAATYYFQLLSTTMYMNIILLYFYINAGLSNDAMLLACGQHNILQIDLYVSTEPKAIRVVNTYCIYCSI